MCESVNVVVQSALYRCRRPSKFERSNLPFWDIRRTKYQSGDNEGEDTNNWVFVFDPAYGMNDSAKKAVEPHILGKHDISRFKKDVGGFTVRVYAPKQVEDMHAALRELDDKMSDDVELDGLEAPQLSIVTVANLDLPPTKASPDEQEGVTALMLEGFSYPLYKHLRTVGYDFYRGVHGQEGINRWCRVVKGAADATKAEKETAARRSRTAAGRSARPPATRTTGRMTSRVGMQTRARATVRGPQRRVGEHACTPPLASRIE